MQRAGKADLRDALFAAGLSFLGASAASVIPLVGQNTSVYLPAGPGSFATTLIGARTANGQKHFVYSCASTWLSESMLRPDQTPLPRAAAPEQTTALALWRWHEDGRVVPTFANPEGGRTAPA
jgi:hypothetical protein